MANLQDILERGRLKEINRKRKSDERLRSQEDDNKYLISTVPMSRLYPMVSAILNQIETRNYGSAEEQTKLLLDIVSEIINDAENRGRLPPTEVTTEGRNDG